MRRKYSGPDRKRRKLSASVPADIFSKIERLRVEHTLTRNELVSYLLWYTLREIEFGQTTIQTELYENRIVYPPLISADFFEKHKIDD